MIIITVYHNCIYTSQVISTFLEESVVGDIKLEVNIIHFTIEIYICFKSCKISCVMVNYISELTIVMKHFHEDKDFSTYGK